MRAVISPNDVLDARRQLHYRSMLGNSSNRMLGTYFKMRALISPYDVLHARQYHKTDGMAPNIKKEFDALQLL